MQNDDPMAQDPFSIGHRETVRKAIANAASASHDDMRNRATAKGLEARKPKTAPTYKPYIPDFTPC